MSAPYTHSADALNLLLRQHHGVLSTLSVKEPGFPYGSVLPFCLDHQGQPLLLVSGLAQHTRNLAENPKCSLTVFTQAASDQIQAGARLVLLAEAQTLSAVETEALAPRFYRYLPASPDYHLLADFRLIRLKLHKAHFIAGFGQIHWLEAESLQALSPFDPVQENAFCEDLNMREAELLSTLWHKVSESEALEPVALAGIDGLGGDLRQGPELLRFQFARSPQDLGDAWHLLHQGELAALSINQ